MHSLAASWITEVMTATEIGIATEIVIETAIAMIAYGSAVETEPFSLAMLEFAELTVTRSELEVNMALTLLSCSEDLFHPLKLFEPFSNATALR
jgi:hypothetical protein